MKINPLFKIISSMIYRQEVDMVSVNYYSITGIVISISVTDEESKYNIVYKDAFDDIKQCVIRAE
jgi:hypothetical protein